MALTVRITLFLTTTPGGRTSCTGRMGKCPTRGTSKGEKYWRRAAAVMAPTQRLRVSRWTEAYHVGRRRQLICSASQGGCSAGRDNKHKPTVAARHVLAAVRDRWTCGRPLLSLPKRSVRRDWLLLYRALHYSLLYKAPTCCCNPPLPACHSAARRGGLAERTLHNRCRKEACDEHYGPLLLLRNSRAWRWSNRELLNERYITCAGRANP
jgi:hypothetical protein